MVKLNLDTNKIIPLYNSGLSTSKIGEIFDCSSTTIGTYLKSVGVELKVANKKYLLNENYFDAIDSSRKAYWLGWLYSDGWNMPKKGEIGIEIQEEDGYILDIFRKDLDCTNLIKHLPTKNEKWKDKVLFKFYSKWMSKQLGDKGCSSPKSLTLKFPSETVLPKKLRSHFIRGYFDGDGCVSKFKNGKSTTITTFSLVGTLEFLTEIMSILVEECNLTLKTLSGGVGNKTYGANTYQFTYSKNEDVIIIRDWLYKDCDNLFLTRKKDKLFDLQKHLPLENTKKCCVNDCNDYRRCNGFCQSHYDLKRRNSIKFNSLSITLDL